MERMYAGREKGEGGRGEGVKVKKKDKRSFGEFRNPSGITTSLRSHARQVDLHLSYCNTISGIYAAGI